MKDWMETELDAIRWYVVCLRDIQQGKVVRGLSEAEAGYCAALKVLYGEARKQERSVA